MWLRCSDPPMYYVGYTAESHLDWKKKEDPEPVTCFLVALALFCIQSASFSKRRPTRLVLPISAPQYDKWKLHSSLKSVSGNGERKTVKVILIFLLEWGLPNLAASYLGSFQPHEATDPSVNNTLSLAPWAFAGFAPSETGLFTPVSPENSQPCFSMQISCHFLYRALCKLTFLFPRADVASFPLRFRGLGDLHLWQSIQPLCVTTDPFTSSAQLYNLSWPGL